MTFTYKKMYQRIAAVVLVMVMTVTGVFGVMPGGVFQELTARAANYSNSFKLYTNNDIIEKASIYISNASGGNPSDSTKYGNDSGANVTASDTYRIWLKLDSGYTYDAYSNISEYPNGNTTNGELIGIQPQIRTVENLKNVLVLIRPSSPKKTVTYNSSENGSIVVSDGNIAVSSFKNYTSNDDVMTYSNFMPVTAVPDTDCVFQGWYDQDNNLITDESTIFGYDISEDVTSITAKFIKLYKINYKEYSGGAYSVVDTDLYNPITKLLVDDGNGYGATAEHSGYVTKWRNNLSTDSEDIINENSTIDVAKVLANIDNGLITLDENNEYNVCARFSTLTTHEYKITYKYPSTNKNITKDETKGVRINKGFEDVTVTANSIDELSDITLNRRQGGGYVNWIYDSSRIAVTEVGRYDADAESFNAKYYFTESDFEEHNYNIEITMEDSYTSNGTKYILIMSELRTFVAQRVNATFGISTYINNNYNYRETKDYEGDSVFKGWIAGTSSTNWNTNYVSTSKTINKDVDLGSFDGTKTVYVRSDYGFPTITLNYATANGGQTVCYNGNSMTITSRDSQIFGAIAVPDAGFTFGGWKITDQNNHTEDFKTTELISPIFNEIQTFLKNNNSYVDNASVTITPIFNFPTYTITTSIDGSDYGSITRTGNTGAITGDNYIIYATTLTAVPNTTGKTGRFIEWTAKVNGEAVDFIIVSDSDSTEETVVPSVEKILKAATNTGTNSIEFIAKFEPLENPTKTITYTISPEGAANLTSTNGGTFDYENGAYSNVNVTPGSFTNIHADATFDGWYIGDTKVSEDQNFTPSPQTLKLMDDTEITAKFTVKEYNVKYELKYANGASGASLSRSEAVAALGTDYSVTVDLNGQTFLGWYAPDGTFITLDNPYQPPLETIQKYYDTIGDTVTFTAYMASSDKYYIQLINETDIVNNADFVYTPGTIVMTEDARNNDSSRKAGFEITGILDPYFLNGGDKQYSYTYWTGRQSAEYKAISNDGYKFVNWNRDTSIFDNNTVRNYDTRFGLSGSSATGLYTLYANFTFPTKHITYEAQDPSGNVLSSEIVANAPATEDFTEGMTALTGTNYTIVDENYQFIGWKIVTAKSADFSGDTRNPVDYISTAENASDIDRDTLLSYTAVDSGNQTYDYVKLIAVFKDNGKLMNFTINTDEYGHLQETVDGNTDNYSKTTKNDGTLSFAVTAVPVSPYGRFDHWEKADGSEITDADMYYFRTDGEEELTLSFDKTSAVIEPSIMIDGETWTLRVLDDISLKAIFRQHDDYVKVYYKSAYIPEGYYSSRITMNDGNNSFKEYTSYLAAADDSLQPQFFEYVNIKTAQAYGCTATPINQVSGEDYGIIRINNYDYHVTFACWEIMTNKPLRAENGSYLLENGNKVYDRSGANSEITQLYFNTISPSFEYFSEEFYDLAELDKTGNKILTFTAVSRRLMNSYIIAGVDYPEYVDVTKENLITYLEPQYQNRSKTKDDVAMTVAQLAADNGYVISGWDWNGRELDNQTIWEVSQELHDIFSEADLSKYYPCYSEYKETTDFANYNDNRYENVMNYIYFMFDCFYYRPDDETETRTYTKIYNELAAKNSQLAARYAALKQNYYDESFFSGQSSENYNKLIGHLTPGDPPVYRINYNIEDLEVGEAMVTPAQLTKTGSNFAWILYALNDPLATHKTSPPEMGINLDAGYSFVAWVDRHGNVVSENMSLVPSDDQIDAAARRETPTVNLTAEELAALEEDIKKAPAREQFSSLQTYYAAVEQYNEKVAKLYYTAPHPYNSDYYGHVRVAEFTAVFMQQVNATIHYKADGTGNTDSPNLIYDTTGNKVTSATEEFPKNKLATIGSSPYVADENKWEFLYWTDSAGNVVSTDQNFKPTRWNILNSPEYETYVSQGETTGSVSVEYTANFAYKPEKLGSVELSKYAEGSNILLRGAKYNLFNDNGDMLYADYSASDSAFMVIASAKNSVFTTNNNGKFKISGLPVGVYYFVETEAPSNYTLDETKIYFSITTDNISGTEPEIREVKAYNKAETTQLTISKTVDERVEAFGEAVFIYKITGTALGDSTQTTYTVYVPIQTGLSGQATITIPKGNYTIKEERVARYSQAESYLLNDAEKAVTDTVALTANENTAAFTNELLNYAYFSDNASKTNTIDISTAKRLMSISVSDVNVAVDANNATSTVKLDTLSGLSVTASYENADDAVLFLDNTNLKFNGTSASEVNVNKGYQYATQTHIYDVTYTENGISVQTQLKVNITGEIYKVVFHAESIDGIKGYFEYTPVADDAITTPTGKTAVPYVRNEMYYDVSGKEVLVLGSTIGDDYHEAKRDNLYCEDYSFNKYQFAGWTTADGETIYKVNAEKQLVDENGETVSLGENLDLYAKWDTYYIISYSLNGKTGTALTAQEVKAGTSATLPNQPTITEIGYQFEGWNTMTSGKGNNYDAGASFVPKRSTTLYANWVKLITVTYYSDDDKTVTYSKQYPINSEINTNEDTDVNGSIPRESDGRIRTGWSKDASTVASRIIFGNTFTVNDDLELYAVYQPSVTVTFHDGDNVESRTYGRGETVDTSGIFTTENYRLSGWATSADGTVADNYKNPSKTTIPASNIDLYAVWQPVVTVTYHSMVEGESAVTMTYDTGSTAKFKLTRDNYILKGWAEASDAEASHEPEFPVGDESRTLELYAVWQPVVTITYHSMVEGIDDDTRQHETGSTSDFKFDREGYTLTGWATSTEENASTYDLGFSVGDEPRKLELYAIWKENAT